MRNVSSFIMQSIGIVCCGLMHLDIGEVTFIGSLKRVSIERYWAKIDMFGWIEPYTNSGISLARTCNRTVVTRQLSHIRHHELFSERIDLTTELSRPHTATELKAYIV